MNDTHAPTFTFTPVTITRGRKFRGDAYAIGSEPQFVCRTWAYTSWSLKIWDHVNRCFAYVNPEFLEPREASADQIEADRLAYINSTIQDTLKFCISKSPNETEGRRFARNLLLKKHPEMREYIDREFPDNRDVVSEVEKTIRWAVNLRTRPCIIYGHYCPGGKPYSKPEIARKAYHALSNRGITKLDGFNEAWVFMCQSYELPVKKME